MSVFSLAVDDLFTDRDLARDATFTPDGGDPVAVRVLVGQPDRIVGGFGGTRLWSQTTRVDVRVSDVAVIAEGDRFTIDGVDYVVQGEPVRDAERLVWTVEAVEA